jgi:ABC-type Na+ efflux pump permease subunit
MSEGIMNTTRRTNWRSDLRIVLAITAKDILEALKNKNAIGVVITALFIAVAYSFVPLLTSLNNKTNVLVFDAANSTLSAELKASQALEVYTYSSEVIMLSKLSRGEVPELGLVIPPGFNPAQGSSQDSQPVLTGFVLYWVSDSEITRLTQEVEAEVTRLVGKPVQIQMAADRVIPEPSQGSLGNWVGAALVYLVIYTSLGLISNLMLEEKQTHTLEALLVSPASSWHVITAKAVTGLFYCLLGVAVTMAINYKLILNGWLLIPTILLGSLFSISLGLIIASLVEERGQLALWTFGLLLPLFIPVFFSIIEELFPPWMNQVIMLVPSVTFFQLFQASISIMPPASTLLAQFAWLTAWTTAGLVCAVWLLGRQQRKAAGDLGTSTRRLGIGPRTEEPQMTSSLDDLTLRPAADMILQPAPGALPARPASGWSIIRTIAIKDIRQSIRNKMILSILLGSILLVAGNAVLLRIISASVGTSSSVMVSSTPILAIMISTTLMTLGLALVPILMLDEREAHTLEALLVSPASYTQVVAGKALAGAVYCLTGVLVIIIAYSNLLLHWELALLGMILGTAFVVSLGLLVGMISKNPTTIGMWGAAFIFILLIPAILAGLGSLDQIQWAQTVMTYWPSNAIVKLFNLAMLAEVPDGTVMRNASVLIGAAAIFYMLTWLKVQRTDRA